MPIPRRPRDRSWAPPALPGGRRLCVPQLLHSTCMYIVQVLLTTYKYYHVDIYGAILWNQVAAERWKSRPTLRKSFPFHGRARPSRQGASGHFRVCVRSSDDAMTSGQKPLTQAPDTKSYVATTYVHSARKGPLGWQRSIRLCARTPIGPVGFCALRDRDGRGALRPAELPRTYGELRTSIHSMPLLLLLLL